MSFFKTNCSWSWSWDGFLLHWKNMSHGGDGQEDDAQRCTDSLFDLREVGRLWAAIGSGARCRFRFIIFFVILLGFFLHVFRHVVTLSSWGLLKIGFQNNGVVFLTLLSHSSLLSQSYSTCPSLTLLKTELFPMICLRLYYMFFCGLMEIHIEQWVYKNGIPLFL